MYATRRTFVATGLVALLAAAGVTAAIAADPAPAPPPKIAFLANGIVPADALAAGPIAGQLGAPVYTTRQETLSPDTADALTAYNPELVIVMGGPVAISDAVVNQVSAATGLPTVDPSPTPTTGVVRAAGGDRFETATIVADLLAAYTPAYLPVDLQAVDADLLDGIDSTGFLAVDGKAADAELLDGLDRTDLRPFAHASGEVSALTNPVNVNLSGAAVDVTVPAGMTADVAITFSAETMCSTSGTGADWCKVDFLVDGSSIGPNDLAFDSSNAGNETNFSWEAHSMTRVASGLSAGTHTIQVRVSHFDGGADDDVTFRLDDWTLTADAVLLP